MLLNCLAVGAGGFIGSVLRYLVSLIPFLNISDIPLQTLAVNLIGAVLIGMLVRSSDSCQWLSGHTMLLLKVGVCGGFTTFSTFSLESLGLIESGKWTAFAIYAAASLVLCIAGVFLGKWITGAVQG